jgi:hypothetical protein
MAGRTLRNETVSAFARLGLARQGERVVRREVAGRRACRN